MDDDTWVGALDGAVRRHIRAKAILLHRTAALPGHQPADIEQEFLLDLWRRRDRFDPGRSDFTGFVRMVVAHRAASLATPTTRSRAERRLVSLQAPLPGAEDGPAWADLLTEDASPDAREEAAALQLDVRGFVAGLPLTMQRCCAALVEGSIGDAAEAMGLHRSTLHETVQRIRRRAVAAGLDAHLGTPDKAAASPVCTSKTKVDGNERHARAGAPLSRPARVGGEVGSVAPQPRTMAMAAHRTSLGEDRQQGEVQGAGHRGVRAIESARCRARRDSATAAAMSDPDRNVQFRRRWVEPSVQRQQEEQIWHQAQHPLDDVAHTIRDEWRRGRFVRQDGTQ